MTDEEIETLVKTQWPALAARVEDAVECFKTGMEFARSSILTEIEQALSKSADLQSALQIVRNLR